MTQGTFNRFTLVCLLVATFIAITIQIPNDDSDSSNIYKKYDENDQISKEQISESRDHERFRRFQHHERSKRATRKPGFFKTLFSVIYEQWDDTRQTAGRINTLVNDNFLPENAPPVETTTSSDPNATTTKPPYKITRSEFNRIVQRNLRGLARLYNIELKDALKQSDKNWAEYKKNASIEVSKFL